MVWAPAQGSGRAAVSIAGGPQLDAFGRMRVSEPHTIFDSKQLYDNAPLFWDDQETSGSGTTSSHSANTAMTTIGVGATTAGTRVRQTFRRFNYEPGKSQLVLLTGILEASGGGAGITTRIGAFDEKNGLFFEDDEGTIKFVRRTYTSGSAVDNKTTLPTEIPTTNEVIDWSKTQIMWIDMEWLGVGKVRAGIVNNGTFHLLHSEDGANEKTLVYMSTPNLPLRYEIDNDGTGAASTLGHICCSVISEGGTESLGVVRCASTGGTHIDLATENTLYGLIGIRLKSTHLGATIELLTNELQLQTASHKLEWEIRFDPTITGGTFTFADVTNSAVQAAVASTAPPTISDGTPILGGFLESGNAAVGGGASDGTAITNALLLGSFIDGTQQTVVLCARPVDGSTGVDVEATMNFKELS